MRPFNISAIRKHPIHLGLAGALALLVSVVSLGGLTVVNPAQAQVSIASTHNYIPSKIERKFSKFAKKGKLFKLVYPVTGDIEGRYAVIDNVTYKLTAGFTLNDEKGVLIVPPSNATTPAQVAYILQIGNQINKMWILTDDEYNNFEDHKFK